VFGNPDETLALVFEILLEIQGWIAEYPQLELFGTVTENSYTDCASSGMKGWVMGRRTSN